MLVGDALLHGHQFVAACHPLGLGEMAVEAGGRRVVLEGVGEHAEPLEPPPPDEVEQLLELATGLPGEPGDEGGAQHEIGDRLAQRAEKVLRGRTVDAALHALEHRITRVLQRQVEVGHDPVAAGDRRDEPVGEVDRVEVHEPDPLDAVDPLERREQLDQSGLPVDVDPVEGGVLGHDDELAHAVGREFPGLADHLPHRLARMPAAHAWNRAEGARPVAPLGDLEIGDVARRHPHASGVVEGPCRSRAEDAALLGEPADEPFGGAGHLVAREDADRGVDARPLREQGLLLPLGEAAGDDHAAGGARPLEREHLVDHPVRLLPRRLEERARVHDHEVGAPRLRDELPAVVPQEAEHALAVDEVLRTAEADEGERAASGGGVALDRHGERGRDAAGRRGCGIDDGERFEHAGGSGRGWRNVGMAVGPDVALATRPVSGRRRRGPVPRSGGRVPRAAGAGSRRRGTPRVRGSASSG